MLFLNADEMVELTGYKTYPGQIRALNEALSRSAGSVEGHE